MLKEVAPDFPVTSQYTYVNTAACGLLSESLMEWRQEHDIDYLIGGSSFKDSMVKFINGVRTTVATFFGSKVQNTMLVPNFSFGLNVFLKGLPGKHKVLLLEGDYPSVNWPLIASGHEVLQLTITENIEEEILEAVNNFKPSIFAFSIVQYITGFKITPGFVNELKNLHPELIVIGDGTQYFGTEPFNFETSGFDAVGSSGYKWLLAGYGNGFFLLKDGWAHKLYAESLPHEPQKEPFLEGKNHLMYHFEPGHLDTLNFGSLQFSLNRLDKIGLEAISDHLAMLSAYAKEVFGKLGVLDQVTQKRKLHSTIFKLNVTNRVLDVLAQKDVLTSVRGGGLRVSFHIYNTKKDIDKVALIIRNHLK